MKMIDRDIESYTPGEVISHPDGFTLQIRVCWLLDSRLVNLQKSRVDHPESGYGVWVEGRIIPGTVIALYPGVVYLLNVRCWSYFFANMFENHERGHFG